MYIKEKIYMLCVCKYLIRKGFPVFGLHADNSQRIKPMNKIQLTLPWPPKELSPNNTGHWARKAKARKAYRTACRRITEAWQGVAPSLGPDDVLGLVLTFYPPDKRAHDWDNLIARMKNGIDGVADGLGVNDRLFRPSVVVEASQGRERARVEVTITVM